MVYTAQHQLLTVHGEQFTGSSGVQETWQFGIRFLGSPSTVTQALVDSLATPTATLFADVSFSMKSIARLAFIKLAQIDVDGHYVPGTIAYTHSFSPMVSGAGTAGDPWPPQCAVVITERTALPRGRAHAGRFYLPVMQGVIGTDGKMPAGRPAVLLGPLRTWLNAINGTAGMGVASVMSKVGAGATQTITKLECGNVVDTQRKRRRQLVETRVSVNIP